jgi:hypothetical protein
MLSSLAELLSLWILHFLYPMLIASIVDQ